MAVGGSYNARDFQPTDPMSMMWQMRMWDYETTNPFARGEDVPQLASTSRGRNYLGGTTPPQINVGGRNYGDQGINRGELDRLGTGTQAVMGALDPLIDRWRARQGRKQVFRNLQEREQEIMTRMGQIQGQLGQAGAPLTPAPGTPRSSGTRGGRGGGRQPAPSATPVTLPTGVPTPPGGSPLPPPPPQGAPLPPPTVKATPPRTPHPLATSNWREEQAQRIAELELGEPGQPTRDLSVDSRIYARTRAEERAKRAEEQASQPAPTPATSAQRWERAEQLKAEREAAVAARGGRATNLPQAVPNRPASTPSGPTIVRPGSIGSVRIPSPMSIVGDQGTRLESEGVEQIAENVSRKMTERENARRASKKTKKS